MDKSLRNQSGQAVVEYVLMLVLMLSLITLITTSFRSGLFLIWGKLAGEVAAACPKCEPPRNTRF